MPIYEYRCSSCGFQKEFLQKVTDPRHTVCPDCGKDAFQKMLSAAGFQLKGSGWYATRRDAQDRQERRRPWVFIFWERRTAPGGSQT